MLNEILTLTVHLGMAAVILWLVYEFFGEKND